VPRLVGAIHVATRAEDLGFESGAEILGQAARLEAAGRDLVRLDLGEPDLPTPPNVVEAATRALRDGVTRYTPPGGLPDARAAVAEHVSRTRGVDVEPRQVILTSGSTQALLIVALALVEPGDEVILPDPGYPLYPALVRLAGGVPLPVRLREEAGFRYDLDELAACVGPRTRVLLLNSPSNPSGGVLPACDLEALADLAERHRLAVLTDEVYGDLVCGGERAPSILSVPGAEARTVCVDSFSKAFAMCGWRIGFMVAPPWLAARLEALMLPCSLCAPSFAQVAAAEAVRSEESAAARRAIARELAVRREAMVDGLNRIPGVRCHRPEGAFYALPDVRGAGGADDDAMARRLLERAGVVVLPGSIFGAGGAGHLRLSCGAPRDRIAEGLARFGGLLGEA